MDDNRTLLNEFGTGDEMQWLCKKAVGDDFAENCNSGVKIEGVDRGNEIPEPLSVVTNAADGCAREDDFSATNETVGVEEVAYSYALSPEQNVIMPFALSGESYDFHIDKETILFCDKTFV